MGNVETATKFSRLKSISSNEVIVLLPYSNALASSFVKKSEQPCINEMQSTPLEITIDDLQETNKTIFVMFTLSKQKNNSFEPLEQSVPDAVPDVPIRFVFDVLMV